VDFVTKW